MSRYIDADILSDALRRLTLGETDVARATMKITHYVSRMPTADVRENVRGEWLPHPINGNREWDVCSACGVGCKRREYGIHANGKKWVTEYNFPFCPNCGAEMEKGQQNEIKK